MKKSLKTKKRGKLCSVGAVVANRQRGVRSDFVKLGRWGDACAVKKKRGDACARRSHFTSSFSWTRLSRMAIYFATLPPPLPGSFSPQRIPQFDRQGQQSGFRWDVVRNPFSSLAFYRTFQSGFASLYEWLETRFPTGHVGTRDHFYIKNRNFILTSAWVSIMIIFCG